MYFSEDDGHHIRKVTVSTGIITTVVGTGTGGYSGDGGLATSAKLSYPFSVAVDSAGNSKIFTPMPLNSFCTLRQRLHR